MRVQIEAPAAFVWDVLVDYARYPEWNPFTIEVRTTLEIGSSIELTLPSYDGTGVMLVSQERVREVEPPHHLRYDNRDEVPGVLGVRDQWIASLGPGRCSYVTTNTLSGEHAALVIGLTGEWIKSGLDSVARALKVRAEELSA
ncbi:SRPBCC domain-containing protein [Aeromicrobium sp. A1-2]|uniref:SRPBCC domain-containing protein n=1 Tax=Aeromicrobium sp. A1-2 TaxID=2107713 RepID=UPI0020B146F1|nr:SRPBCC domain-containing protein [Aeromicrobium sp. A1-2]